MRTDFADLLAPERSTLSVKSLDSHFIGRLFAPVTDMDRGLKKAFKPYTFINSWFGSQDDDFVANLKAVFDGDCRIFPFRPSSPRVHITDYYASCLGVTGPVELIPEITLTSQDVAWRRRFWSESKLRGKQILALAPGSGAKEKNWSTAHFAAVGRWWRQRTGGRVMVVLGPAEKELEEAAIVGGGEAVVLRHPRLRELAALLAHSDVYLGNDNGVTHLAAAVGVPTVALFGPTDPVQWQPRGENVTVITRGVECAPCTPPSMRSCTHHSCLATLSPETVIGVLETVVTESLLDKRGMQN